MMAGVHHLRQIVALTDRQRIALEQVRQADHGVQRRPQLVAHVGEEGTLGDIGDFRRFLGLRQFPRALRDEFFQVMPVPIEFLGHLFLCRDVLRDDDHARHTPCAIADDATARGHHADTAVGDDHPVFEITPLPGLNGLDEGIPDPLAVVRMDFDEGVRAVQIALRAEEVEVGRTVVDAPPVEVEHGDEVADVFGDQVEELLLLAQLLFRHPALRDVGQDQAILRRSDAIGAILGRHLGGGCGKMNPQRPIDGRCHRYRRQHAELAGLRLAGFDEALPELLVRAHIFSSDEPRNRLADQGVAGSAEQRRSGAIGLQDLSGPVQGAIAHRRQVVEIEIGHPRRIRRQHRHVSRTTAHGVPCTIVCSASLSTAALRPVVH